MSSPSPVPNRLCHRRGGRTGRRLTPLHRPSARYHPLVGVWLARGINALLGLGLMGSAAAGGLVAGSFGWLLGAVATVSGLLGVIWALSFFHATIPAREVPEELVRRVRDAAEDVSAAVGIAPPGVVVSSRAVSATISWCNDKPRMAFPSLWAERLSDEHLRAYLAHELAHIGQKRLREVSRLQLLRTGAAWNLGLGTVTLVWLLSPGGFHGHRGVFVLYALVPLVLTVILALRRLALRHTVVSLELDADRQAVGWGVSPDVLAATLDRLQEPALAVRQPLYQRALRVVALYDFPRSIAAERMKQLRSLSAGVSATCGEGNRQSRRGSGSR
jgi:Zn-dependent protease with chaperone function